MDYSIQKVFDWTRKTTLTVFFHTIFPSEPFGWKFFRQTEKGVRKFLFLRPLSLTC